MSGLTTSREAELRVVFVDAIEKLIQTTNDAGRKDFLRDFQFHIQQGIRPIESESIDDLHLALYEEWFLIRNRTPWLTARKVKGVVCCHFKKSTEQRPLLEAECRRKGIDYTLKTTRFELAALLEPELPGHCENHMNNSYRKRRQADQAENKVYFRGNLVLKDSRTVLRGCWSSVNDNWVTKSQNIEGFHFWTHEDPFEETVRFYGYFKIGADTGVPEKSLFCRLEKSSSDPTKDFLLSGTGENSFGTFTMTGHVLNSKVVITRHYTQVFEQNDKTMDQEQNDKPPMDDQPLLETPTKRRRDRPTTPATALPTDDYYYY